MEQDQELWAKGNAVLAEMKPEPEPPPKPRKKPGPKPGPRLSKKKKGPDIVARCPHWRCCVRFCKSASLLKPGRTPESADAWERFCGKHLPANAQKKAALLASVAKEASALGNQALAKRRERLIIHEANVHYATEPMAYGEMAPSNKREHKGWGLVEKGKLLHYFAKGDWYSLCGKRFMANQPVTPNFGPRRCLGCASLVLFTDRALE